MIVLRFPLSGLFLLGAVLLAGACGNSVAVPKLNLGAGGDDPTTSGGNGNGNGNVGVTASSTSGSGSGGAGEPPSPGPMKPGDGGGVTLAVTKLYLGDTDRDGTPDATNGWKHYGFNIDGKISTKNSTDLCKPVVGASPTDVYPDGDNGIDNSFGQNVLPILLGFAPDFSTKINDTIAMGQSTYITQIQQIGGANDYNPVSSLIYNGANLGMPPKFNGQDVWPVHAEDLSNPADIASTKLAFPQSYLVNGTWVSGPPMASTMNLSLRVSGYTLVLPINRAVFAMNLSADHQSATNGTFSGVVNTEAFIAALQKVMGSFDKGLCTGSTFESIATQLRYASDIMSDGTQDPSKTCDAISIGSGFDAQAVTLGPIAPLQAPPPDPCAP